jgi:hypothetical protein
MADLEHPELKITNTDTPDTRQMAAQPKHFKLRISLPGKNIGGEWLCRLTGAALAYQNYCGAYGTPRVFQWYAHKDGLHYLQDQEGNWLSWESSADCLYMSSWTNAAAWKIEGGRLIRVSDNAVLTWKERQRWTWANERFLMALPASAEALTVEVVDAQIPMDKILAKMIAVFEKPHKPFDGNDLWRFQYSTNPSPIQSIVYPGQNESDANKRSIYAEGKLAFFAVNGEVQGEETVPVYLLRRWSEQEHRNYYKLSLKTAEDGYSLESASESTPNFRAFVPAPDRHYLVPVYEHTADTKTPGFQRYVYDFIANEHDGWSKGTPVFSAITPKNGEQALVGSIAGQNARDYALQWISNHGNALSQILRGLRKENVNRGLVNQFDQFFKDMPVAVKYYSLGAGVHGGYGFGTVGVEMGSIWRAADFGQVPMHTPLSDYSVEWVTFGAATGADIGGSFDAVAIGTWFGEITQIEGACNGITLTAQLGGGGSVTLMWDGSWLGANFTAHPIGVTAVAAVGIEAGAGVFYNASATQFWNRRPDFPKV